MKGMKGKLLKKLKTVKAIEYLKPDRIILAKAFDGYLYTSPPKPAPLYRAPLAATEEEAPKKQSISPNQEREPEIIDVTELMKDLQDEEVDDKENVSPKTEEPKAKDEILEEREVGSGKEEIDATSFRRPDLNSKTLFDPNLLAAFEQAVMEVRAREADRRSRIESRSSDQELDDDEPPPKSRKLDQLTDPLTEFEEKCPPGGSNSVILYTTGLRGIRKTFEDCQKIRSLLENLKILFLERDISMHSEFKEELWRILDGKVVPPRLFIKGRYIGGAEEVIGLHEQGKLKPLLDGVPVNGNESCCEGCVGFRFLVCFNCNGSRKSMPDGDGDGEAIVCSECNENGLIVCPFCS